jgi:hypothetical protein
VRFKLDENLGEACAQLLRTAGHDVETVPSQRMAGSDDRKVIQVCRAESRCLVTMDAEFGNPLLFPPWESRGTVVLRLPGRADKALLMLAMGTLVRAAEANDPDRKLWIVEPARVRVYQPDRADDQD